jgi:hypothetical protein
VRNTSQTCLPSSRDSPRSVVRSVPSQSRFARLAGAIRDHDPVAIAIYFQTRPDLLLAEPVGHGGLDQDFTPRWPTYIKSAEPGLAWPGLPFTASPIAVCLFCSTSRCEAYFPEKKSMTYRRMGLDGSFSLGKTPTRRRYSVDLDSSCGVPLYIDAHKVGKQRLTMYCSCGDRRQVNVKVDSPDSQAGVVAPQMST